MARPTMLNAKQAADQGNLWTSETVAQLLEQHAKNHPGREAYIDRDRRLTWSELQRLSCALASSLLAQGLKKDDVVFVQVPNNAMAIVIRFAMKWAGLLGALIPMQWRSSEIVLAAERARPAAAIVAVGFKDADLLRTFEEIQRKQPDLRKLFTLGPDPREKYPRTEDLMKGDVSPGEIRRLSKGFEPGEVSWLLTSSGSTGVPKLIEWQEAAQVLTAKVGVEDMELTKDDVVGVFAPLSGYAGLYGSMWGLASPVRTILADDFTPERLFATLQDEKITVMSTVPPVLMRMMEADIAKRFDLSSLRSVRVGTAQFAPAVRRETEAMFGCPVLAAAGSMETGVYAQCRLSDDASVRLSQAVGKSVRGSTCLVVDADGNELPRGDVGELVIRSAIGACGYYRDQEASQKVWNGPGRSGWYHTADLAVVSEQGHLALVGRKKDIINRGGNKVLPLEVERTLVQQPKVANCAVVGVQDKTMGEVPCAWIVRRQGEALSAEELRSYLRESGLATYKVPAHFVFVEELPLLGNGKVDRRRLAEEFNQQIPRADNRAGL